MAERKLQRGGFERHGMLGAYTLDRRDPRDDVFRRRRVIKYGRDHRAFGNRWPGCRIERAAEHDRHVAAHAFGQQLCQRGLVGG